MMDDYPSPICCTKPSEARMEKVFAWGLVLCIAVAIFMLGEAVGYQQGGQFVAESIDSEFWCQPKEVSK